MSQRHRSSGRRCFCELPGQVFIASSILDFVGVAELASLNKNEPGIRKQFVSQCYAGVCICWYCVLSGYLDFVDEL
jgi:hypothetical protein